MSYPPPPPFATPAPPRKPPAVAWLIPLAAVPAIIGVFTPWFSPQGTFHGRLVLRAANDLYSWKDGKIGLVAPIALAVLAIGVVGLLSGRSVSRFQHHTRTPTASAARSALIVGVISLVAVAVAWFLVPGQYDNIPSDAGGSWDGAQNMGIDMSRGPQLGFWLTVAAGVLALLGGVLLLLADRSPAAAPAVPVAPQPAFKDAPGVPGASGGWTPPATGYQPQPAAQPGPPAGAQVRPDLPPPAVHPGH